MINLIAMERVQMFRSDKEEKISVIVKKPQSKMVKHQVADADSQKLPKQWVAAGSDYIKLVAGFLDNKAAAHLTQTCHFLYHKTNDALDVGKLAHYTVVELNEDKVIAMLTLEPTLVNAVISDLIRRTNRANPSYRVYHLQTDRHNIVTDRSFLMNHCWRLFQNGFPPTREWQKIVYFKLLQNSLDHTNVR